MRINLNKLLTSFGTSICWRQEITKAKQGMKESEPCTVSRSVVGAWSPKVGTARRKLTSPPVFLFPLLCTHARFSYHLSAFASIHFCSTLVYRSAAFKTAAGPPENVTPSLALCLSLRNHRLLGSMLCTQLKQSSLNVHFGISTSNIYKNHPGWIVTRYHARISHVTISCSFHEGALAPSTTALSNTAVSAADATPNHTRGILFPSRGHYLPCLSEGTRPLCSKKASEARVSCLWRGNVGSRILPEVASHTSHKKRDISG